MTTVNLRGLKPSWERMKLENSLSDFKTYYKATVIKRVVLVKDMHIDEWKRLRVKSRNITTRFKNILAKY